MPAISVVCPTFNSAKFIARTLESAVNQTLAPREIIISDDGSTDDTVAVVEEFFSRYSQIQHILTHNSHRGAGATRNAGIQRSSCEWIAFLDSDDLWRPQKLEVISRLIEQHPEFNIFCHAEEQVGLNGSRHIIDYAQWYDSAKPLGSQLYHRNFFSTSAVTCQRKLLFEGGLFDETILSGIEDFDLWQRIAPFAYPYFISEPLGYYFDRSGNLSFGGDWKKWKDSMRLAFRYGNRVTPLGMAYHISKVTAFHALHGLQHFLTSK
jgi:glycosyltransferase involved in cell wall biosynthesis